MQEGKKVGRMEPTTCSPKGADPWWCSMVRGGSGEGGVAPSARGAVPQRGIPLGPTYLGRKQPVRAVDDEVERKWLVRGIGADTERW
jgi:hypothetical protein